MVPAQKQNFKDLNLRPETIKLLEENMGSVLFDRNHSKILSDPPPRWTEIKIIKWNLIKLKSFCTAKYKQDEKTTLRMGENNCKWNNWQKVNLQNIEEAPTAQYQKNKQLNQKKKKKAEDLNRHFSKKTYNCPINTERCSTSLKIRDANQNYNEVSPHTSQNGHHQKNLQTINA